jgi:hypothetical protein
MTKKKSVNEKADLIGQVSIRPDQVMIWKAKRQMTEVEHKQLSEKLRIEEAETGVKIMLVPFSCEAEVADGKK